ncbi:uncharacterized protein TNCV_1768871 [Trichonephila clavipes]|nr:uncharacterized protein TNCV_1768871 [Trichonephila clavipes]
MRNKEDLKIRDLLMQELEEQYLDQRESMCQDAKQNILKIQAENKNTYNKKRKKAPEYQEGRFVLGTFRSCQNDRLRVMLVLVHIDITPPHTPLPVFRRIGERTIPYSWRGCKQLRDLCETALRSNGLFATMFDGLVDFSVDRWRHDSGVRRAVILAPDEGCVKTSWKSAGGTDADTAFGNTGT